MADLCANLGVKLVKYLYVSLLVAFTVIGGSPSGAQVTLDQLDKGVAAQSDALDAFRSRLQDPDPVKARAAMRILIAKGDDAQRRLAISHGFGATDPVLRLEAVRGILDAQPRLVFRWAPESTKKVRTTFKNAVTRFSGVLETGSIGRVTFKVGPFSDEKECWTYLNGNCFARIHSGELSISFTGSWAQFVLNREGQLVGRANISGTMANAVADLTQ